MNIISKIYFKPTIFRRWKLGQNVFIMVDILYLVVRILTSKTRWDPGLQYFCSTPCLSYKATTLGGPSGETAKTEFPCHIKCGMIRILSPLKWRPFVLQSFIGNCDVLTKFFREAIYQSFFEILPLFVFKGYFSLLLQSILKWKIFFFGERIVYMKHYTIL